MRTLITVAFLALSFLSGHATSAEYDARIDALANEIEQQVIDWRHDIHQHPELSNREFRTSKLIADHLRSIGFDEVYENLAPTGVVGILRGEQQGERIVALRADIDALPVKEATGLPYQSEVIDEDYPGGPFPVAHACGHDTHVAMLMGAASILADMRETIPGTVMVIFQPAEEGPPLGEQFGARAMVDAGIFNEIKPDAVFGMHITPYPVGMVGAAVGVQMGASEVIKISITGSQTHGSMPFMGLDPLPVLAAINDGFAQIYRQVDTNEPMTISIGKIDTVGRTNIIGGSLTAYGTVRAARDSVMDDINTRLQRVVENAAKMHGLTATLEIEQHVPAVTHDPEWIKRFKPTAARVVGEDNLWLANPTMGYDDVSVFMNEAGGGVYYMLGGQNTAVDSDGNFIINDKSKPIPNHNPAFYAEDEALKTGVRLHVYSALDYLSGK